MTDPRGKFGNWWRGVAGEEAEKLSPNIKAYLGRVGTQFRDFGSGLSPEDPSRRLYISPLTADTGTITGLVVAYLNNNRVPAVWSAYRDGELYLPQAVQLAPGPNRLLLIGHERDDKILKALESGDLSGWHDIEDVLYSWWFSRTGSERIHYPMG